MMRRLVAYFAVFLAAAPFTLAEDLDLVLRLEHRAVLQFEPLFAFVLVRNKGVEPFAVSSPDRQAAVRFVVKDDRGKVVPRVQGKSAFSTVRVATGKQRLYMRNVARWYDLRQDGSYVISVEAEWKGRTMHSAPMRVDVVPGISLLSTERRVSGQLERVRTYDLRYWPRRGMEQLFLRVDEPASGMNYGVFLLGPVVRVSSPKIQFGADGRVVVLHQSDVGLNMRSIFASTPAQVRFIEQQKEKRHFRRR